MATQKVALEDVKNSRRKCELPFRKCEGEKQNYLKSTLFHTHYFNYVCVTK